MTTRVFAILVFVVASMVLLCTDALPESFEVRSSNCTGEYCTQEYAPVCGSDGKVYGNKCSACSCTNQAQGTTCKCTLDINKYPNSTNKTCSCTQETKPCTCGSNY